MICPHCKKEIDLPFEVEICPHCNKQLTNTANSKLEDDVIITNNPFIENNIVYPVLKKDTEYLEKYTIKEHITNKYPFAYYHVEQGDKKYILQLFSAPPLEIAEIEKKLKKELSDLSEINTRENINITDYGIKNSNIYFVLEYFPYETLEDILNTTDKLKEEFIFNLISFLIKWYDNTVKPHIFLSPANIINLGNNQFKVLNYSTFKILANFIKPFYFFNDSVSKYLPPELFQGNRVITKKADIYSIGKIWDTLITNELDLKNYRELKDSEVKNFIEEMTIPDYEERKLNKEKINNYISDYLNKKSAENFITQKISVKDIILEEENIAREEEEKEFEEIIPINENEIEPLVEKSEEQVIIEEIEPEIIQAPNIPPQIPSVPPPKINKTNITQKEFLIAKKQFLKNPVEKSNLEILYSYYSENQMLDEAYVVSSIIHFVKNKDKKGVSDFLFNTGKTVEWKYDKSILTDENLQKILPKRIYFNASGVMNVLYDILQKDLPLIKTIPSLSNYSILLNDTQKKEIVDEVIKLSGIDNVKFSLTTQEIYNSKDILTAIYQRNKDIYLIMKKDLCEEMKPYQFKIILSKLIFMTHPSIVGNIIYDMDTIKDIFYGVMKFVVPSSRYMYNSKISNMVSKELERQKMNNKLKRSDIIRLVMLMNDHLYNRKSQPDMQESLRLIELASDRFALIVSNDLNATLKTILNYKNIFIKLQDPVERMIPLLKYALSDNYFQIRKSIKQSIKE